jgi:hypothetical protein
MLISEIVDTNKDGIVFLAHQVATADLDTNLDIVEMQNNIGSTFYWTRLGVATQFDEYRDKDPTYEADFWNEKAAGFQDGVYTELGSPSQPTSALDAAAYDGLGDDGFIDIDLAPGVKHQDMKEEARVFEGRAS